VLKIRWTSLKEIIGKGTPNMQTSPFASSRRSFGGFMKNGKDLNVKDRQREGGTDTERQWEGSPLS
jgi:hypothetical protein